MALCEQCPICLESTVSPSIYATNSIQCNCGYNIFESAFAGSCDLDRPNHDGCRKWFHKTCLKKWHRHRVANNKDVHCPSCRCLNSFVWSSNADWGLTHCIFQEDFLQHALLTRSWDLEKTKSMCKIHGLSLLYSNSSIDVNVHPDWLLCARKRGGLVANAVYAGDVEIVRYLVNKGAPMRGVIWDREYLEDDSDAETLAMTERNEVVEQYKRDTLLMVALNAYEKADTMEKKERFALFQYLVDHCECTEQELKMSVYYPHQEDALLYVIRKGYIELLRELLPTMLTKHKASVLLQWSLKFGGKCFPMLVANMQRHLSQAHLECALLACAYVPLLDKDLLELVYSALPSDLKRSFLVKMAEFSMKLGDRERIAYLLFRKENDFYGITQKEVNELLIASSLIFNTKWNVRFSFANGYELVSQAWDCKTCLDFFENMYSRATNGQIGRPSTKRPTAARVLLDQSDPLSERSIRCNRDFTNFNVLELLLLKLRAWLYTSTPEIVHEVLYRALLALDVVLKKRWVSTTLLVNSYLSRVVTPIVAFYPACLHEAAGGKNVLLFCAKQPLGTVLQLVFQAYHPDYNMCNARGQNCLYLAIKNENHETAMYLLTKLTGVQKASLKLGIVDKDRRTLLMACATSCNQPWTKEAHGRMYGRKRKRYEAALQKAKEMARVAAILLQSALVQQTLGCQDIDGNTALHHAYMNKNKQLVDLFELHMSKAERELKNDEGLTAAEISSFST